MDLLNISTYYDEIIEIVGDALVLIDTLKELD